MLVHITHPRLAALAAAGVLGVGAVAANAGTLPAAAQDALAAAAQHAGVSLPSSTGSSEGGAANGNDNASGNAGQGAGTQQQGGDDVASQAQGDHGAEVSDVAQSTDPGSGHGEAVSAVASANGEVQRTANASSQGGSGSSPNASAAGTEHRAPQAADAGGGRPEGAGKPS